MRDNRARLALLPMALLLQLQERGSNWTRSRPATMSSKGACTAARIVGSVRMRIDMPSPFPGMDPYLEGPEIFPDFHDSVITYLREALQASLPAPYFAALGRRVWIEVSRRSVGPDVQIQRRRAGITVHLSPLVASPPAVADAARRAAPHGQGRTRRIPRAFRRDLHPWRRRQTTCHVDRDPESLEQDPRRARTGTLRSQAARDLASKAHLVEIDLLRAGDHVSAVPLDAATEICGAFDYHVSVHCFDDRETYFVYPIGLEERLPPIAIPLLPGDEPVTLDLQAVFDRCYDAGPYAREVRYGVDPVVPALKGDQAAWASQCVAAWNHAH